MMEKAKVRGYDDSDEKEYAEVRGIKRKREVIIKKIKKEVEKYQKMNKNKNRDSETENVKRKEYLDSLTKLFDIADKKLVEILMKDRLLGNDDENPLYRAKDGYMRKTEDVAFLEDQRGGRRMVMAERDVTFEARVKQQKKSCLVRQERQEKEMSVRKINILSLIMTPVKNMSMTKIPTSISKKRQKRIILCS